VAAFFHHRPVDPLDRSASRIGGVPKYRAIRWLAHIFRATGAAEAALALIVLTIGVLNPTAQWAFDPTPSRLATADHRLKAAEAEHSERLARRKLELDSAHPDARELLSDQLTELAKKFESDRTIAAVERAQLLRDVDLAIESRSAQWVQLFSKLSWVHYTLLGGLISLGIGQMIAAFRDMAINSFRGP
jgi:hypothetical protein